MLSSENDIPKVHDAFCKEVDCSCPERGEAIDGTLPSMREHLCIRDLTVKDGPVEDCCVAEWMDEGALP